MVLINRYTIAAFFFIVLTICLFPPRSVYSQDDPKLGEILSGFEDDEKSDDDLQGIMQGFEEEAGAQKSSEDLKED